MSDTTPDDPKTKDNLYVILALQGGGALGAFQAGAYQALSEYGYEPDWVAGISIGAINASIIAGNKTKKDRLNKLSEFWELVAGDLDWWERIPNYSEKLTNIWRVSLSSIGGVSGFFRPNYIPAPFADPNSPEASSWYNTDNLKETLRKLVDFEFLKKYESEDHVRLSLGATRVFGAESRTFQSFDSPIDKRTEIKVEHIMASGALAPWFPGVWIPEDKASPKRELYWDGGITSNSSFKLIIEHLPVIDKTIGDKQVVIFVVDLWGAFEREPKTFDEVCWRIKQTQYSSRIEQDIRYAREYIASARLLDQTETVRPNDTRHIEGYPLPGDRLRQTQTARPIDKARRIDVVRVSYRSHPNEIPSGDALFSRTEIRRRLRDGYAAMLSRLETEPRPPWLEGFHRLSEEHQRYRDANVAIHLF